MRSLYFDHNATTPIDPEVAEAMAPYLADLFGNPSSQYPLGRDCRRAVEEARAHVAALINAEPDEIVFTSGGSEANNMALKGVATLNRARKYLVCSTIEHDAVLAPMEYLARQGHEVGHVGVDDEGRVLPEALAEVLRPQTALVSIMHANNEVGTVQDIARLAADSHAVGALFHSDAAQSVGKIPVDIRTLNVDLLSLVGHKLGAPKGIGALYVRSGVKMEPLIHGGGQECKKRAGTENVPFIVGMGHAARLCLQRVDAEAERLNGLRERLAAAFREKYGAKIRINAEGAPHLPNTLHVSFLEIDGSGFLLRLPQVQASTGSACHAASGAGSHVLQAMGRSQAEIAGALRVSIGHPTTEQDVTDLIARLPELS